MTGEESNLPSEDDSVDPGYVEAVGEALRRREAGSLDPEAFRRDFPDHAEQILDEIEIIDRLDPDTGVAEAVPIAPPAGIRDRRIGPYRLVDALGRGGQGHVYRAEDSRLGRTVALKLLPAWLAGSAAARLRFAREAEIASKLQHPGICTVYDVGDADGLPYIAMAYIDGRPLSAQIAAAVKERSTSGARCVRLTDSQGDEASEAPSGRRGAGSDSSSGGDRRAVRNIVRLIEAVARALHVAHEHGLVHRDVKPANLMITRDGKPVLVDFGLARADEDGGPTLTRTGDVVGTPAYLSPEQASGEPTRVDQRTDVYSLGVVLYECLTLETPFRAPTRQALYRAIQLHEPPDPRRRNRAIGRDLLAVLQTALEKDPARRYQSAEAFADDLRAVADGRPVSVKPISATRRAVRWARRRPAAAALVVLIAVGVPALAATGGILAANWDDFERGKQERRKRAVEALLEAGFLALGERSNEAAIGSFRAALALGDPAPPEAVAGLAIAHLQRKKPERALEVLNEFDKRGAEASTLEWLRLDALRAAGRTAAAAVLEPRLEEPRTPLGYFVLGLRSLPDDRVYHAVPATRRALDYFRRAFLHSPVRRSFYVFEWARAAGYCRDEKGVDEACEVLTAHWPDSAAAWHVVGFARSCIGSKRATEAYEHAIRLNPNLAEAHCGRALHLEMDGRMKDAIAAYREAIARRPAFGTAWVGLCRIAYTAGKLDQVIEYGKKAIETDEPSWEAHNLVGSAYYRLDRLDQAIVHFEKAHTVCPDVAGPLSQLALVIADKGRIEEAIELARKAVQLEPESANSHRYLGDVLAQAGRFREAIDCYGQALEHFGRRVSKIPGAVRFAGPNAGKHMLYWGRALAWEGLGEIDEAIGDYRKAIEDNPRYPGLHRGLGRMLQQVGKLDKAIEAFAKAVENEPDSEDCHADLGVALLDAGRLQEAGEAFLRTIELDPGRGKWLINLAMVRELEGRPLEAWALYRDSVATPHDNDLGTSTPADVNRAIAGCERAVLRSIRTALRSGFAEPLDKARNGDARREVYSAMTRLVRGWREDLERRSRDPSSIAALLSKLGRTDGFRRLKEPALVDRVPETERDALRRLQAEWKRVAERVASHRPAK